MKSFATIGAVGAVLGTTLAIAYLRRQIQGYWYDKHCTAKPDLNGITAIVTGGNNGIGFETAAGLLKQGAEVIIACRNPNKAKAAVELLKKNSGNSKVSYLLVDFADISSVKSCAKNFLELNKPLHILVNNAGIINARQTVTQDNFEETWQVNYIGPWIFTILLLQRFMETAIYTEKNSTNSKTNSRIVFVSSGAHSRATINWENPNLADETPKGAYGQSKLAQILHAKKLHNYFIEKNVPAISVATTPGFTLTSIHENIVKGARRFVFTLLFPIIWILSRSPKVGAQTVLHCCMSDDIKSGGYYSNCVEKTPTGKDNIATNDEASEKLWEISRDYTRGFLTDV